MALSQPRMIGRAARRLQEAQDHADGCGLAGSVTADECEDAAARHAEGNAVDSAPPPEVTRQPAGFDRRVTRIVGLA